MTTDTTWTWTILMNKGRTFHFGESITLVELLQKFHRAGFNEHEIEAIIRH